MFNEDLLTRCRKPYFKRQHMKLASPPQLLIKKRNMKLKKLGNIENEDRECNIWYIGRVMGMNMTNRL